MNVTVRQLRAFVFVAQLKNFTKAAERLYLTQSALSLLIRQLEDNLQVQLVERSTRKVELTAAGLELMGSAERLLDDLDATLANVAELGAKQRGNVVVAAPYILATTFLVEVIAEFRARYPTISVHLKDLLPEQVLMQVRSGGADLGIGSFREREPGLQWIAVSGAAGDGLSARPPDRETTAAQLERSRRSAGDSLNRDSIFRDLTEDGFSQAGLTLTPAYEVAYAGTALALVRAGLGIAILPQCVGILLTRQLASGCSKTRRSCAPSR